MPEVYSEIAALRARLHRESSIGLVPTMGALHRGHARLLETARRENDFLVASIFVNPAQFDRKEDLENYPRTMEEDLRMCGNCGVDLVFAPAASEMYPEYPDAPLTFVDIPALTTSLCGAHRPGHFRGVATVVLKLLNIVQPHRAYFGEKDAQQLAVIRRMVQDLNAPVTIVPVATVREEDGLALSSRNKHLTPDQRAIAPLLSRALRASVDMIDHGERSTDFLRNAANTMFARHPEARLEYFEITNPDTLTPVERITGPVFIAGAMWLGTTRLIDNMSWSDRNEPVRNEPRDGSRPPPIATWFRT
jgi:pantoate--beta-alanine ligase